MPRIDEQIVELARADLVGVIGRYVELQRKGTEYVARCPFHQDKSPSFTINPENRFYYCFGCGATGNAVDFVQQHLGLGFKDAVETIVGNLPAGAPVPPAPPRKPPEPPRQVLMPAPGQCPSFLHPRYGQPAKVWAYDDMDGRLLGYVARYEPAGERKQIVPWTCTADGWGMGQWPEPRPLYGLSTLGDGRPVLLVEGEKAADAARAFAGHVYAVLTWPGGSQAWRKVSWTPLLGRKILLWPDNDAPGRGCMEAIGRFLAPHCPEVKVIDPSGQPDGWDAADSGFDWPAFKAWAVPRVSVLQVDEQPEDPPPTPPPEDDGTVPAEVFDRVSRDLAAADASLPVGIDTVSPLPDVNGKGRPLSTLENVREVVRRLGVTVRYNVVSKDEEIIIPGSKFSIDNAANASLAWLMSWCARFNMPTEKLADFVTCIADENLYNPAAQWITSRPWDRKTRLPALCATIRAVGEDTDSDVGRLKNIMIRRWLISAVAAAFEPDGVAAGGILVLQGAQYLGKTKWFKSLVPTSLGLTQDGMMLRPDDRDSVKQACSFWLVELGELDATFRKADIAALKAFITRKQDVMRRAYARKESHYARRTVFFASVNQQEFLADPTGNRRYWTIACEAIDHSHDIDMQQLWAEAYELYLGGESWYLEASEVASLNAHNEQFSTVDPVEQRIQEGLDWDERETLWRWTTVTKLLIEIGVDRPTHSDTSRAGITLTKKGVKRRIVRGTAQVYVPSAITHHPHTQ